MGRARSVARGPLGFSVIDLVFASTALCVVCAIAIPHTLTTIERARGLAAARYLAMRMTLARAQAVSRSHAATTRRRTPKTLSVCREICCDRFGGAPVAYFASLGP